MMLDFSVAYAAACAWERWRRGEVAARRLLVPSRRRSAGLIAWAYLAHPGPDPEAFAGLRYGSLALQLAALAAAVLLLAGRLPAAGPGSRRGRGRRSLLAFHAPANPPVTADLYYPETPPIAFLANGSTHGTGWPAWGRRCGRTSLPSTASPTRAARTPPSPRPSRGDRTDQRLSRPGHGRLHAPEDPLYSLLGVRFLMTPPREFLSKPYRLVSRRGGSGSTRTAEASAPLPPGTSFRCTAESATSEPCGSSRSWTPGPSAPRARDVRLACTPRSAEPGLASSVYQDGNWKLLVDRNAAPRSSPTARSSPPGCRRGEARIDLLYRPGSFVAGLAVAALGLAAGAALWVPPPQTAGRSQAHSSRSA